MQTLKPDSGDATGDVTYTSYGTTGNKPLFLGSVEKNKTTDWSYLGSDQWATTDVSFTVDVGNIIFNNGPDTGIKVLTQAEVNLDRAFFYDGANNRVILYSYSTQNPADKYSDIEITKSDFGIDLRTQDYITISDLEIKYVNVHGIRGGTDASPYDALTNITISNVDISYTGGKVQTGTTRYGNGIEFWGNANDILVENCNITQIYDAGLTNQSPASVAFDQTNITYRDNNVTYSKMGIEIWSRNTGTLSDINVLNNTFSRMGNGWSQTSDNIPWGSAFYASKATVNNIVIRDNVFDGASGTYMEMVVLIGGGNYTFERNIVRNGVKEGVWIKKHPPDDYTDPQNPIIGQNPNVEFNYNLAYGNGRRGVRIGDAASLHEGTISLYNNVIMNNATDTSADYSNVQVSQKVGGTLTLKNNIMKGYTTMIRAPDTGITRNFAFDYNSYYRIPEVPEKVMIYYYGINYTLSQFSDYQTASCPVPSEPCRDVASIAQDPLLVDAANNDFHLQLNSPCIDKGTDVLLTQDFEGNPVDLSPDIGAYECQRPVWNLSTGVYYDTLQAAYDAALNGQIIQSQGLIFTEDLNLNLNISVRLEGGLNCNYSAVTGDTTINGTMTISDGTVTAGGFELE